MNIQSKTADRRDLLDDARSLAAEFVDFTMINYSLRLWIMFACHNNSNVIELCQCSNVNVAVMI